MNGVDNSSYRLVHCRIGSLEMNLTAVLKTAKVHCRIGSLEMTYHELIPQAVVHCRIGSLEKSEVGL